MYVRGDNLTFSRETISMINIRIMDVSEIENATIVLVLGLG